jgi:antitoxin MazE
MEQVAVKAWGNSQGIRIPKNVLEQLNIHISDILQMEVEDDTIILKKTFKHKSFEERLAEYDGKITVSEFDWGDPAGKELL